jgi:hypothetical protein
MSPLTRLVFAFTQELIELIDKLHELLRVHFSTGLFRKVFPIVR